MTEQEVLRLVTQAMDASAQHLGYIIVPSVFTPDPDRQERMDRGIATAKHLLTTIHDMNAPSARAVQEYDELMSRMK
ncbi:hypothetical protein D3C87_1718530 [compost metagenome]